MTQCWRRAARSGRPSTTPCPFVRPSGAMCWSGCLTSDTTSWTMTATTGTPLPQVRVSACRTCFEHTHMHKVMRGVVKARTHTHSRAHTVEQCVVSAHTRMRTHTTRKPHSACLLTWHTTDAGDGEEAAGGDAAALAESLAALFLQPGTRHPSSRVYAIVRLPVFAWARVCANGVREGDCVQHWPEVDGS